MFKSIVRALGLTCLASVVCWTSDAQGAATLSLKAVAKNGTPIAATNNLAVVANDTITVELFFSGWSSPPFDGSSGLLQTFQGALLGSAGAISNGADPNDNTRLVLPVGWNAPVVRDSCPCDNPLFPNCDPFYGCVAAGHNPASMASINTGCANGSCTGGCCVSNLRSDFILYGFDNVRSVDTASLNIRWGGTINSGDAQASSRCVGGAAAGFACTTNADCPTSTCNAAYQSYGGTLNLKVGSNPCGTYTFTFVNDLNETFIGNASAFPVYALPAIQPLVLTTGITCPLPASGACCDTTDINNPTCSVIPATQCTGPNKRYGGDNSTCQNINPPCAAPTGACCNENALTCTNNVTFANCSGPGLRWGGAGSTCGNINPACPTGNIWTNVTPPNCAIDARRPFPPGAPAQREGFKTLVLDFANPPGASEDAAADFQVTQVPALPAPPNPPAIQSVVAGPGATQVTLTYQVAPQSNRWTCLRHIASNVTKCHGHLPGDANSNRTVAPADILDIIDNLNGVRNPPLVIYQCDIDRSNQCAPADIITQIDLLNGANGFPVQNGDALEVCPSAP